MNKKKILIICPYPEGLAAGQRLKYEQYFKHWKSNDYELTISSYFDINTWKILYDSDFIIKKIIGIIFGYFKRIRDLYLIKKFDIVYIFMWVTPLGSTIFEHLFVKFSKKIIYDFNDSIYLKDHHTEKFIINHFFNFLKTPNKCNYLIKNSNHVIIDSLFHYNYCHNLNKYNACTHIPCSLDVNYFYPINKNRSNDKIIRIGWTGTFSSKIYLDNIKNVFVRLNEIHKFKLIIIGNFDYSIPNIDVELIKWKKTSEIKDLQSLDIGIYPLIKNNWTLGKGALKAMQYMALEIPTVASDLGTTSNVITNNFSGILVNNENEWVNALDYLIRNPKERQRIGRNAREEIVKKYSSEILKSKYLNILNKLSH